MQKRGKEKGRFFWLSNLTLLVVLLFILSSFTWYWAHDAGVVGDVIQ